ncbi:MAG TPA: heparan-alpha-glucosaminide N-acetyltransferase domain-containing protein [Vicinamibacterales bacterium]|jgi:uncharacterized membrane protein|nr:heparan-alpha-glucosaminide N-acetyltransferase domain-containing protein [Vicinamibacterales bacterium]
MALPGHRSYRLTAIDMLRGLAIVVMAIDHVRDYFLIGTSADPMTDPNVSAGLFAARWITHFCAPVFVLLAGTSAGLMSGRKTRSELGRFLFTRGVWLIAVEVFVIATAWSFAPGGIPEAGGRAWTAMQVIWAIGGSMVALSGLQWLGRNACLALGVAVVVGHNLLDPIWPASQLFDQQWPLWVALHSPMSTPAGPFLFVFRYPLLPWIGVMLLGFGVSRVFELPPGRRNALLLRGGVVVTLGFVLLRASGFYGDPNPWQLQPGGLVSTVIDFLNTTKYPPSLLFLLMTLGPAAVLCALADRVPRAINDVLVTFGRAPFAFYVAHLYLIHLLSVLLGVAQGFTAGQTMTMGRFYPSGFGVGPFATFAVWVLVVAALYPLCRWVAGVKARRRDWWLSYL